MRVVDRSAYVAAGKYGLIGFNMPEEFGGGGSDDFRFNAVILEELAKWGSAAPALSLQNDIVGPYLKTLTTPEQRQRWLPGFITGEIIGAIAMSEPGAGSDLAGVRTTAVRDGTSRDAEWILTGSKTFISSGINADLVIVVARTDPEAGHRGFSLLVVERGMAGFTRGRKLDKMGQHSQDTAELQFDGVRVPAINLLGEQNRGFYHLMHNLPSERLSIAKQPSQALAKHSGRHCNTPRTATRSVSRSEASSTTGSCWPSWTPSSTSPSSTSIAA